MPPKAKIPAPIDRPLSRAYLREFSGWSTEYPPGLSDPTSLRVMENILVNRDGAARVRPGLRLLTQNAGSSTLSAGWQIVGTFEPFYLNDGSKAYLFAVLDPAVDAVRFKVAYPNPTEPGNLLVCGILDAPASFTATGWTTEPEFGTGTTYVKYVQIDNKILALSNNSEDAILLYVGATKKAPKMAEVPFRWGVDGGGLYLYPDVAFPDKDWINGDKTFAPTVLSAPGPNSLYAPTDGDYFIAFMHTFSNDLGESKPSRIAQTRVRRPLGGWLQQQTDLASAYTEPQGAVQDNPAQSADQLVINFGGSATEWNDALAAGATHLNLYVMSWSVQSPVPVELNLYASKEITGLAPNQSHIQLLPGMFPLDASQPIPTDDNRVDTTNPPNAGQGIVAADRLILVNDKTEASKIKWTTNQPGNYLNFSATRGGGVKTLTAGNLQIPACVKLWQNPQSVDTIVVLCTGTDGYSTAYYMAPANVTSQSDNVQIMGFEETTATPGTVSPYGCEVANNALYHPLEDQLMKSTASNYNINHKAMTDQIANVWQRLANKQKIVSCFYDQRLFFLVQSPEGEDLEPGCMGNEVWVLDLAAEKGNWSRWLVQGVSLRKLMLGNRQVLCVVRPDGLYALDDLQGHDDYLDGALAVQERSIPWKLETNTQGANRAHDAWCHLQQANLTVGNFTGTMRYGVRGKDRHGRVMTKSKLLRNLDAGPDERFDIEDMLLVKLDLREWFFFAESVEDEGVVRPSYGQLNLVQYRYTPISVNQDYEEGSVETFEYGRDTVNWTDRNTLNGVTIPRADTGSP